MLDDCSYDKIKLLHDMSKMAWFIDQHAKHNAEKKSDDKCIKACQDLKKDLEAHIKKFREIL